MKTLMTVLLALALITPGTAFAGPNDSVTIPLWQSVVSWITDALDGLPDVGRVIDPAGAAVQEPEGLPDIGGNGLTVEGEKAPKPPGGQVQQDEPPALPSYGGAVDPAG